MPYLRPGNEYHCTAVRQVTHGNPCIVDGVPGIAISQKEPAATAGLVTPRVVAVDEDFVIAHQGICQIDASLLATGVRGDPVFINNTTDALAEAGGAGLVPFGRIIEVAGERGTPTGKIRINMNLRDTIAY